MRDAWRLRGIYLQLPAIACVAAGDSRHPAARRGTLITEAMLTCRRPATGISPALVDRIAGRPAAEDIPAGAAISWGMLT